MIRQALTAVVLSGAALGLSQSRADDAPRYVDEGGIRYRETTQVTQRPITETKYVPLESTVVRERLTTEMQDSVRTYQVPITEQQWVPGYQRSLNPFAPPTLSYRLMPVTRWETRTETVKVPVTKREYVPEKQVRHEPVHNTRIAEERVVRREAVGHVGGSAANVARNEPLGSGSSDSSESDSLNNDTSSQQIDRRR